MISSATLFLATLALHFAVVLGAPISIHAEIAPRSVDTSESSVRFAREETFPEVVPAFVKRAFTDVFPVVKREVEGVDRHYPRRFIYEHLEKRGTSVHEKVTVIEKTIKHDTPADTVAFNNGQPHNGNGDNNGGVGGFTTSFGFSTTIDIPGVPTPTATSTSSAPAAPTPTPTPDPSAPGGGTTSDAPKPDAPKPDAPATPDGTTTTNGGNPTTPAAPKPDAPATPAPGNGTTTTDGSAPAPPDGTTTTGTTTTDGAKPAPDTPATPATPDGTPAPDGTTTTPGEDPNASAGAGEKPVVEATTQRRDVKAEGTPQLIAKRQLATSGAVYASSLRRRAL